MVWRVLFVFWVFFCHLFSSLDEHKFFCKWVCISCPVRRFRNSKYSWQTSKLTKEEVWVCVLKSRDITSLTKVHLVKAMVFPVVVYGSASWIIKKAEHWGTDAFELWCRKRLLRVMYCKIQPVHPKGDQPWIFIGRTDAKAEAPILWPPDAKSWLTGKDPDSGKDWRQEKGTTEDEMAGWHHWLDGHWVWVNSGSWWWTGKPGMLQSMG